jgi:hypothetical protein
MASEPASSSALTWAALLAKWTEFARASVALPRDAQGERWRGAVPSIIALQACVQALGEVGSLSRAERAVALDKAALLVRTHAAELHALWKGEALPAAVGELIDDAGLALRATREGGLEWTVATERYIAEHPAELCAALAAQGFDGTLLLPTPGVPLFEGCPAAFVRAGAGGPPGAEVVRAIEAFLGAGDGAVAGPEAVTLARQAYRQFDFARGGPVRDLVRPMDATLPAGQPLLVLAMDAGALQPVTLGPRWGQDMDALPVEIEDEPEEA